jgi:hypothetical protein
MTKRDQDEPDYIPDMDEVARLLKQTEYEDEINAEIERMKAAGQDVSDQRLGDVFFSIRTIAKLRMHNKAPNDVIEALYQQGGVLALSKGSGRKIVMFGRLRVIIDESTVDRFSETPWTVTTGFDRDSY